MMGRPLKFESPEILEEKINEYFAKCEAKGEKPLITELALFLDTTRETLCDYRDKDAYSDSIKKAKLRCQVALERNLVEGKVNPTGTIFNLKNNYGWRDKTEVENEHKGEMSFTWKSRSTTSQEDGQISSTTPSLAG